MKMKQCYKCTHWLSFIDYYEDRLMEWEDGLCILKDEAVNAFDIACEEYKSKEDK